MPLTTEMPKNIENINIRVSRLIKVSHAMEAVALSAQPWMDGNRRAIDCGTKTLRSRTDEGMTDIICIAKGAREKKKKKKKISTVSG